MSRLLDSVNRDDTGTCEGAESKRNTGRNKPLRTAMEQGTGGEPMPDDLRRVVNRWADLPEPIRAAVLAIVEASP